MKDFFYKHSFFLFFYNKIVLENDYNMLYNEKESNYIFKWEAD